MCRLFRATSCKSGSATTFPDRGDLGVDLILGRSRAGLPPDLVEGGDQFLARAAATQLVLEQARQRSTLKEAVGLGFGRQLLRQIEFESDAHDFINISTADLPRSNEASPAALRSGGWVKWWGKGSDWRVKK